MSVKTEMKTYQVSDVLSPEDLAVFEGDAERFSHETFSSNEPAPSKEKVLELLAFQRMGEHQLAAGIQQVHLLEQVGRMSKANGILGKGNTGEDVKNLQQQLNEWRVANGKLPIKADGIFGAKTEEALKDFQTSTGLQTDGLAGPNTKARLNLENSNDFQQLNPSTQNRIRGYLNSYQKDPGSRDNLLKLAKDPNFNMLPPQTQDAALDTLSKNPGNIKHTDDVIRTTKDMTKLELTPEFQKLPENIQSYIRNSMFDYSNNIESRMYLSDLVKSNAFGNLTQTQQLQVLVTNSDGNPSINLARMQTMIQTHGFQGMEQIEKNQILDLAIINASNPQKLDELGLLLDSPEFVNASKSEQQARLTQFE